MNRAELERLYSDAEYRVLLSSGPAYFHVDRYDPDQESRLLEQHGDFSSFVILTPFNPWSVALCEQENLARLENFRRELHEMSCAWLPSVNHDPAQCWPDEPGALIFDLPWQRVEALGRHWQQNAVVRAKKGFGPALVWLVDS